MTSPPISTPPTPSLVPVLENVTRRFGDLTVLDHVSLSLVERGVTCLLGPSGCGKSTLLRVAAGLLPADAGGVCIDPRDCAMVFQDPRLLPWLTVAENLGLALKGGARRSNMGLIREALSLVELGDVSNLLPRELSGGMAQRVGLARALLRRPEFLLMDEPFASLDAITRGILQNMLLNLVGERKATCLFVTHDIGEALLLSDRLEVMKGGRLMFGCPVRGAGGQEEIRERILSCLQTNEMEDTP